MSTIDATLTTTTPAGASATRPVPPSWASVAPLLARWQMALFPHHDGTWSVLSGYIRQPTVPQITVHSLPFAAVPAAIADVAARCAAEATQLGTREEEKPL